MAYGFRSNDYGCFGENMLSILNQYLTPEALSGKKCIDLTLGNIEDTVTIFKNMKEVKVEQKMGWWHREREILVQVNLWQFVKLILAFSLLCKHF